MSLLKPDLVLRHPFIQPRSWQLTLLREALDDDIGIWEMVILAREEMLDAEPAAILAALSELLEADLLRVGVQAKYGGFEAWPGSQADLVDVIGRKWRALGRDPYLGEIGWLHSTSAGEELARAWPLLRFVEEPRDALYEELLDWLVELAEHFLVVIRDEMGATTPSVEQAVEMLRPWRSERRRAGAWPGTMLLSGTATLLRHRCRPSPATILFRLARGPFDWQQPALPEDLCFLDAAGRALSINVAHEGLLSLDLAPAELDDLRHRLPEVVDLLRPRLPKQ